MSGVGGTVRVERPWGTHVEIGPDGAATITVEGETCTLEIVLDQGQRLDMIEELIGDGDHDGTGDDRPGGG